MVQDYYNQIVKISKGIHNSAQIDSEKEQLLKDYPHIFVLGCVMDSQIKYERAWKIPLIIAKELSGKGFDLFLNKSEQWYINFFEQKKLHRYAIFLLSFLVVLFCQRKHCPDTCVHTYSR